MTKTGVKIALWWMLGLMLFAGFCVFVKIDSDRWEADKWQHNLEQVERYCPPETVRAFSATVPHNSDSTNDMRQYVRNCTS